MLAECKEMLKKEIRQEWETLEMGRIRTEMKKELENKFNKAMAMIEADTGLTSVWIDFVGWKSHHISESVARKNI